MRSCKQDSRDNERCVSASWSWMSNQTYRDKLKNDRFEDRPNNDTVRETYPGFLPCDKLRCVANDRDRNHVERKYEQVAANQETVNEEQGMHTPESVKQVVHLDVRTRKVRILHAKRECRHFRSRFGEELNVLAVLLMRSFTELHGDYSSVGVAAWGLSLRRYLNPCFALALLFRGKRTWNYMLLSKFRLFYVGKIYYPIL